MRRIPGRLIVPIIKEYLRAIAITDIIDGDYDYSRDYHTDFVTPRRALASDAGIPDDSLYRLLTGKTLSVHHDTCDQLLCAMDKTYLWFQEPLSDYYISCSHHRSRVVDGFLICSACGVAALEDAA